MGLGLLGGALRGVGPVLRSCLTTVLSATRRMRVEAATRRRSTRTIVAESVGERETCGIRMDG